MSTVKASISKRAFRHLLNRASLRSTSIATLSVMLIAGAAVVLARNEVSFSGATGEESTDNAYVRADQIPISTHIAGYIMDIPVADNARVEKDQVIALIRDDDYSAKLESAEADLAGAKAAIDVLTSQAEAQRQRVASAKALAQQSKLQSQRQKNLASDGTTSQREMEAALADATQKAADVDAQENTLQMIVHQIAAANQTVKAKTAARDLARIDLGYTHITSPAAGQLGARIALPGQYVSAGMQIGLVVPLPNVWIVANFRESQIAHMQPGQSATITVDGVPGHAFKGRVDSISPASGALQALLPPDNATGNFTKISQRFGVKITLIANQDGAERLRPGMSAIASVTTAAGNREHSEAP